MKDIIVVTLDDNRYSREHLRKMVKSVHSEADLGGGNWVICPPYLTDRQQDAIRKAVRSYFEGLRRGRAETARKQAEKLAGRFSFCSSIADDADTITITIGQPAGPYTGWHDTRETAQRIAAKIGGKMQPSGEPLPKASVVIAKL